MILNESPWVEVFLILELCDDKVEDPVQFYVPRSIGIKLPILEVDKTVPTFPLRRCSELAKIYLPNPKPSFNRTPKAGTFDLD